MLINILYVTIIIIVAYFHYLQKQLWNFEKNHIGKLRKSIHTIEKVKMLVIQFCLTLCNPMDCSPPGFSVHGILQARILEWEAIPFSRGSSWPRDRPGSLSCSQIHYHLSHNCQSLKVVNQKVVIDIIYICEVPTRDFPGGSDGKASVYNAGDLGSIPGSGRFPGEGNGNPLQYPCLENLMVGGAWCPWGHKESETTEWLHFTYVKKAHTDIHVHR